MLYLYYQPFFLLEKTHSTYRKFLFEVLGYRLITRYFLVTPLTEENVILDIDCDGKENNVLSSIPVPLDKTAGKEKENLVHNNIENDYLSMCLLLLSFSSVVRIRTYMRLPVNTYIFSPPFFLPDFLLFFLIGCSHTSYSS
jgi:hypothetical protein